MSKNKKIILGILTFSPFFFLVWYFFAIFSMISRIDDMPLEPPPEDVMMTVGTMLLPMILLVFVSLGLIIYYLIDVFKYNTKIQQDSNSKLIWTLVILLTSTIGMIVYFFVEIMPRKELPPVPGDSGMV